MSKFRFAREIKAAVGTRWCVVEAASLEEAKALAKAGKMEYEDEDVQVIDLGEPEFIIEIKDNA